ncbi:MAG: hypothetical protein JWO95_3217, partial [Verrucomicrobiales bacterium]|nr:hypothetical protein [Verrucomicrobiales bacterium]
MKRSFKILISSTCALLMQWHAFGQQYYSNDVTPAGSAAGELRGGASGKQVGGAQAANGYSHAVLVTGNALTAVDLNPANCYYSMAMCADDIEQGGWGYTPTGIHALVWNGSASSYSDLNPSGYSFSYCLGVDNGEQVGYAQNQVYFVTASHSMCWHGTAGSCIDLHPPFTYPFSRAFGCKDGEEVGYVSSFAYPDGDNTGYHTTSHAVKWNGSAATAVDLNPIGFDASESTCTSGTQEAGWAYSAADLVSHLHAMLWSGTANSAVDLHPAGYVDSRVNAMNATMQVGEAWTGVPYTPGSIRHALAWTGNANSVVDLNQYLPAGYTNGVATGIDANGNVVGSAYNGYYSYGLSIPVGAVAVVFAPGAPAPTQLASITLSPSNVVPGDNAQCTVTLGGSALAGGVNISFLSTDTNLVSTPASVTIPEGANSASFTIATGGTNLTVPTTLKLYATDGSVSSSTTLTLTPVVKLSTLAFNAVEGGFSTYGSVSLNIPAQASGATVSLTSSDTSLVTVAPTMTLPQSYTVMSFSVNTAPVTATTLVPITATLNGQTISGSVSLSPAPVISVSGVSAPEMVGGQPLTGTVTLNNFPRAAAGATITLVSGDATTMQVPATVTVPFGVYSVTFPITTTVVSGRKGISLKASYNGSSISTTVFIDPIPTVTIIQADYLTDTHMFKVAATTTFTNAVLTYGGDPGAAPMGTMQFEAGQFKGSIILDTAPTRATVWNS